MNTRIGCFGSVLYHSAASARCQACPLLQDCIQQVNQNEVKLKEWYEALIDAAPNARKKREMGKRGIAPISAPEAMPVKRDSVTASKPLAATGKRLMKKPQEAVDRWCAKGIKFDAYMDGVNPFTGCGNKFAEVAMQFFMDNERVHKHALIDHFVATLGWQIGTAGSHVNIIFDSFEYLGIISVHGPEGYLFKRT